MKGIAVAACLVALSACANCLSAESSPGGKISPEPATTWVYSEHKDEMRGSIQYTAYTRSMNSVNLPFPYAGGSNMLLAIRKTSEREIQAMLIIQKGQISCTGFNGCSVALKFDDKPIYHASAVWAGGGATDTIFIENASGFIKRLRASRRLIAELPIYNAGYRQFTFETAALKWGH